MSVYIDREAALRDWPPCDEPADAYQYIRSYPAADVRPVVRGKWNNIIQGIIPSGQCSNCKAWDKVTRFCPNCGADMRKES